jgi:RimJ/RimL family protein N-acetyltransferase
LITGDGLVLRRWRVGDAEVQAKAVAESAEHLRPWMPWIGSEPMTLPDRRRMLAEWERDWRAGGDVMLGVLFDGRAVGGCGLHRRLAPNGLEIGYWIHPGFTRRGLATRTTRLLTDAAFTVEDIELVEIHHDKANVASAGVPRNLGFEFIGERVDGKEAPAEEGIEWVWRMDRDRWSSGPRRRLRAARASRSRTH